MTGRLIGREEELGAVVGLLDEPGEAPDVAVLAGEAGIGKTTVWLAALDEAVTRGYRVLAARPSDVEAAWSFAALGDLLGNAAPEVLPGLPPVQRRALEAALLLEEPARGIDERTIAAATLSALRTLAERQPVVLAVDDVQWLDPASLAALRFVLARLEGESVAALLTVRGTAPEWLLRAVPAPRLRTVEVLGLSLGATTGLLRTRLDAIFARPTLIKLWTTSGGNPFFALELATALQRRGGTLAVGEELPISTTLDELLGARLDGLGADALEVARVVAALAEPAVALVEAVVEPFDAGLSEAQAARILELDGRRLRFTHPLLGAAVTARETPSQRRALHARLAAVAPTSEQRARHLALATVEPDDDVAEALEEAARSAYARGASTAAAELAEQSHALTPHAARAAAQRRLLLTAELCWTIGETTRARALLEQARLEAAPGVERAAALVALADVLGADGYSDDESKALFEAALAEAAGDDGLQARIRTDLAELHTRDADPEPALVHARLAVDAAARSGDVALTCCARAVHVTCTLWAGEGLQRAELEAAMVRERALADWPLESGPTEYLALHLMCTSDAVPARALLLELRDAARAREAPLAEAWKIRVLSQLEWRAGNWDRAERYATDAATIHTQLGTDDGHSIAGTIVAAHRGRVEEARRAACERIGAGANRFQRSHFEWILGFADLSLGDHRSALEHLRQAHELLGTLEPGMRLELGDFLEALVAVGELDEAEQVLEAWEPRAARLDRVWALAILARGRGLVLAARGDFEGAFGCFERALAEHARAEDPFQHARTLLALGRTQRRAKRRADARRTLTDALARFEQLGAPLWAEQARDELARIGGRVSSGDELTEAESRIAALVAEGRTNREVADALFLTVHSVETALTRVYRKLGVRSRAELTRRLGANV